MRKGLIVLKRAKSCPNCGYQVPLSKLHCGWCKKDPTLNFWFDGELKKDNLLPLLIVLAKIYKEDEFFKNDRKILPKIKTSLLRQTLHLYLMKDPPRQQLNNYVPLVYLALSFNKFMNCGLILWWILQFERFSEDKSKADMRILSILQNEFKKKRIDHGMSYFIDIYSLLKRHYKELDKAVNKVEYKLED